MTRSSRFKAKATKFQHNSQVECYLRILGRTRRHRYHRSNHTTYVCSIIGYCGSRRAAPLLLNGLRRMEYRGYDSAGVATFHDGKISVRKGVGRVAEVNLAFRLDSLPGGVGIGHTRSGHPRRGHGGERPSARLELGSGRHSPQRHHRQSRGPQGDAAGGGLPLQERDRQRGHSQPPSAPLRPDTRRYRVD